MRQRRPWICTNPDCQTKLKGANCLPWKDEGYFCMKCFNEKLTQSQGLSDEQAITKSNALKSTSNKRDGSLVSPVQIQEVHDVN